MEGVRYHNKFNVITDSVIAEGAIVWATSAISNNSTLYA